MSAATRLSAVASVVAASIAVLGVSSLPSVNDFISRTLGPNTTRYSWRGIAILLALLNLKNLPGFWHIRVLRGIFYQLYAQPTQQPPKHLFAPMITSTYNTLYDTDYNLHKTNSSYFADLDVSRAHLVGCIVRTGLARLNRGDEEGLSQETKAAKGTYALALGGVSCFFHRQIEPLQSFEIYTRLLAWDRKWIYCVSHIVKKGVIKPERYVLQPWKKSKRRPGEAKQQEEDLRKHIFATSVARYVFKKGRLTINPEVVLERSHLLPARPDGVGLPPRSEGTSMSVTPAMADTPVTPAADGGLSSPEAVVSEVNIKLGQTDETPEAHDESWTWEDMERERLRGLRIASHFDALSGAQDELKAGDVLGQYGDYW